MIIEMIDFFNFGIWTFGVYGTFRMIHLILFLTCTYCIYDEIKNMKKSEKKA